LLLGCEELFNKYNKEFSKIHYPFWRLKTQQKASQRKDVKEERVIRCFQNTSGCNLCDGYLFSLQMQVKHLLKDFLLKIQYSEAGFSFPCQRKTACIF